MNNKNEIKDEKIGPVDKYVKFSFTITYILLLTTGTITFIEALRNPDPSARHVMNLETCISVVAGYFYSTFVTQMDKSTEMIDWASITKMRYVDWAITTPMMLLALSIVLSQNTNTRICFSTIFLVVLLNYLMIYIGYLGEIGKLDRIVAMIGGFVPFFAMFYLIFTRYIKPKFVYANYVLFSAFVTIWSLYGFVYLLDENYKNISMNILDVTAKCFIGLSLWMYYTKMVYV